MKWVLGIIAVIVLAIYGYVRLHVYSQTFQFRMTMTVSTPEGEKSASSVVAVSLPGKLGGSAAYGISRGTTYGIAPILDLGRYGTLIAALTSRAGDPEANQLSPTGNVRGKDIDWLVAAAYGMSYDAIDVSKAWRGGKRVLSEHLYPQLVWLPPGTDDPNLARAFHPASIPQAIGADVQVKSITIEPTNAPVTDSVTEAPDWLLPMRQRENRETRPRWYPRSDKFTLFLRAVETQQSTAD
jgi:hypothetical protein